MDLFLIVGLLAAAFIISVTLASASYIIIRRKKNIPKDLEVGTKNAKVAADPDSYIKKAAIRLTWPEIESLTDNFAPTAVVGEGGYSTVYLARLAGAPAAVKVHRSSERLHRAFHNELEIVLRIRHLNIVRLVGYCDDREDGALVFEYLSNGSLHDRLHGSGFPVLSWARRTIIAAQLAAALEYLHEGCDPQIVHGDIKASNVLLDGRLDPKLCDFGSACMGFSSAIRPSGGPTMMGSPGYVDPHYLRTGMISKKTDVYSFGVLLLELVTGAEAFCSETERSLTSSMSPMLHEGRAADVAVDPRLNGDYNRAEAAAMAAVAARCVGDQPTLRPSAAEVVKIIREDVPSSIISAVDQRSNDKQDV